MGQIANQMLLEWCHKMAQKIAERIEWKKSISEKRDGKEMPGQERGTVTARPCGDKANRG